jgi:methyltransferase (TIGR00027 family)
MARTENDSWDPTSGVGSTATFGAVARAVATGKGIIDDPFAEALVRATGLDYFARLVEDARYATDGGDDRVTAGLLHILAMHGRFVDHFLADAGRAGIRQVVILASGLDTRPYRLWWPAGTTVYEIDQPGVIDFKNQVLRGLGAKLTANRCSLGVDLRRDWLGALRHAGFDDTQRTVWIAENLLVGYLTLAGQNRLLEGMTAASAVGSWFAGDHISTWTPLQHETGRELIDGWRQNGLDVEPDSLTYQADYRYLPEHLASCGWAPVERSVTDMFASMGTPLPSSIGPREIAASPGYVTAELIGRRRNASA